MEYNDDYYKQIYEHRGNFTFEKEDYLFSEEDFEKYYRNAPQILKI